MLKRLLTGVVILALTIGFFALRLISPYFFDAYLLGIIIFCVLEVSKALGLGFKKIDIYFVLSIPVLFFVSIVLGIHFQLSLLILYGILLLIVVIMLFANLLINIFSKKKINKEMADSKYVGTYKQYVAKRVVKNLFLMIYPTFLLIQLFMINHISAFSNFEGIANLNIELFLLVLIFVTTIVTDTGAYLVGSGIGGPKLCPKISPKKTISGAIGGVIVSVFFSVGLYFLFALWGYSGAFDTYSLKLWHVAIYAVIASVFTQFGDIFASFVKRKNGIKDYGKILPGHGGVMDRVDGLMFNAVATLIFALIVF